MKPGNCAAWDADGLARGGGRRSSALRRALMIVLVTAAAGVAAGEGPSGAAAEPPGSVRWIEAPVAVPDYAFLERTGAGEDRERALLDFRGRVVVLSFWATWCGVCAKELPKLDRLAGRVAGASIDVLAVSIDDGIDQAAQTLRERGHRRLRVFQDHQGVLAPSLGVRGVPTTFVVDVHGRASAISQGPAEWDSAATEAWLRALLPNRTGEATESPVAAR